jgi:hypothetical protein
MVCREVEQNELIAKYVSGQLDSAVQDDFEIHLLECESCLASVEILDAVRENIVKCAHEVRAYSPKTRGGLRWLWIAIPAICVLVVTAGTVQWTMLRHRGVQTAQLGLPAAEAVEKGKTGGLNLERKHPCQLQRIRQLKSTQRYPPFDGSARQFSEFRIQRSERTFPRCLAQ